jgi:hypothetical protein
LSKEKTAFEVRKRTNIDAIRLVSRIEKVVVKKKSGNLFPKILVAFIGFILLFNISFFGTVGAHAVQSKTNALKLFKQGKYLVIFQNNTEMRPTGGFIGSFAVITFNNYKIQKIDFNTNIYKLDNVYTGKYQVTPPAPLAKVNSNHWALRDSNFAVDFPTAAQNIQWFYEQETALSNEQETALSNEQETALANEQESGQNVDGVIAVNATLVQELLKLTGPIEMTKYQTTVTSDNFFDVMSQEIEKEYYYDAQNQVINEPKTILKDMMPLLMQKAFAEPKQKLLKLALDALTQKMVLFQSNDSIIEQSILQNNWGGAVQQSSSDYLAVNNANVTDLTQQKNGGAKTSLQVKESIDYQATQGNNGLTGNLTLTRSNTGNYAWPDGVNINWTRILVPVGSTLISAQMNGQDITSQIEVGTESGKTTFGLWINTSPKTSNVLDISYNLPISSSKYHLLLQTQPGNTGDNVQAVFEGITLFNGFLNHDQDFKLK